MSPTTARVTVIASLLWLAACKGETDGPSQAPCVAGTVMSCGCASAPALTTSCTADGSGFAPCFCPPASPGTGTGPAGAPATGTGGTSTVGTGGIISPRPAGAGGAVGGTGGMVAGTGGAMTGSGGTMAGAGGTMAGTGGTMAGTGGTMAGTGGAPADPSDPFDALRQVCVDYINMYRATVGLAPYRRGTKEQGLCSDTGAKKDADSGQAHSSAGDCAGLGAQNTCPGWRVGGRSGNATVEDALRNCLDAMWDEGEPPIPRDQCVRDYDGCFLPHGHYINMTDERNQVVACGFYEMPDGRWWMNQNFGR